MEKKLELLAPAGSLETCRAVIQAGADAVYLGGSQFGARAYAQNFDLDQLKEAIDYAHIRDRKIFLTVNTLLKNRELEEQLFDYMEPLYEYGLDAAIVQDFGVLNFLHENFPELHLHASTQMSVTGKEGAELLKKCGAVRIVTARELSLDEIADIYQETGMEIESFVHGALCYCFSGQCLMSSILGGRSGNRGRCAQPCRLAYQVLDASGKVWNPKESYPLSPKDLCAVRLLPEMARAGVYSFKIEGRMKKTEYAAGVTAVYRKYMDYFLQESGCTDISKEDFSRLLELGNRNGFTEGYYRQRNGRSMMSLDSSAHRSAGSDIQDEKEEKKISLTGRAVFRQGQPCILEVSDGHNCATAQGGMVQEARKQPLTEESLRSRIEKTGGTPYDFTSLDIETDGNSFLPVGQINDLRRQALEMLQEETLRTFRRDAVCRRQDPDLNADPSSDGITDGLSVLIRRPQQLPPVLEKEYVHAVFLDGTCLNHTEEMYAAADRIRKTGKKAIYCFPPVFRKESAEHTEQLFSQICSHFDGVLARTYDSFGFALKHRTNNEFSVIADHSLYTYSDRAAAAFLKMGAALVTAPLELNEKELRHRDNRQTEMIIYGWIPMMVTAQCIYKNFEKCHKSSPDDKTQLWLQDRYLKKFLITRNCRDCYNVIYNSQPLYLMHQAGQIRKLHFSSLRIELLEETEEETCRLLEDYSSAFLLGQKPDMKNMDNRYTNGHFRRGVE